MKRVFARDGSNELKTIDGAAGREAGAPPSEPEHETGPVSCAVVERELSLTMENRVLEGGAPDQVIRDRTRVFTTARNWPGLVVTFIVFLVIASVVAMVTRE